MENNEINSPDAKGAQGDGQGEDSLETPASGEIRHKRFWSLSSVRFQMALFLCFLVLTQNVLRINLSMAMICMVNSTAMDSNETNRNVTDTDTCQLPPEARSDYEGEFLWSSADQAFLFSAIFWGGLLSGFPSGWLADRYGPKILCLVGVSMCVVGTFLTPVTATQLGHGWVFVLRFLMGIGQGVMIPCAGAIIARWFPPAEKSTVLAIYTSGYQVSAVVGMPIFALLCKQKQLMGGWPSIFYFSGIFAFLWCVSWLVFVSNTPEKNKRISAKERDYIVQSLNLNLKSRKFTIKSIPWRQLLLSGPMIANVLTNLAVAIMTITLHTYLPTYFKQVLNFDLKSNGLYNILPNMSEWTKFIFAPIADYLKKRSSNPNHTLLCKVFNSIAAFGSALFLLALCLVDCHQPALGVLFLCLANAFSSGYIPGYQTSIMSIAPQFTGLVNSFCRISAQLGSIASPYLIGFITIHGSEDEWHIVFIIIAVLLIASGIVFAIWGSADIQPWARIMEESDFPIPLCNTSSTIPSPVLYAKAPPHEPLTPSTASPTESLETTQFRF